MPEPTVPHGDRDRALELLVAEREARLEAERRRAEELEAKLREQYELVARYREVLRPALWLRDQVQGEAIRSAYRTARRWAWRHPELARPAVALKRAVRGLSQDEAEHERRARERFDAGWYRRRYPDLVFADAWEHYATEGWRAGAWPHPLFDVTYYLHANPDVARAGVEPFGHYLAVGWREGYDPNPMFDVSWYVEQNPDVLTSGVEPLAHFVDVGWRSGRDPSPWFSVSWYLDAAEHDAPNVDPLTHYLHHGLGQGRTVSRRHAVAISVAAPPERPQVLPDAEPLLAAASHPGAHDTVAFDADGLVDWAHGPGAVERAAQRVARVRGVPHPPDGVVAAYEARWSRPRGEVSRAFHQLADYGGQELVIVGGDAALIAELGVDVAQARQVTTADELADGDVLHVTTRADGSPAAHVVPITVTSAAQAPLDRMREALTDLARLYLDGESDPRRRRVIDAATSSALLPGTLVACAIDRAVEHGLDRVHYLSREGHFLARLHPRMAPRLHPDPPRGIHLEVSRRSTFGPSLERFDADALMDLWRMYSRQSVRALLTSLGADPDEYRVAARRHGVDLDETVADIHTHEPTLAFIADGDVTGRLRDTNRQRREALLAYLRSQSDPSLARWLVVDVGWRGTIQDNLARLLPETHVDGLYLANFPFLNPQPANTTKGAVAVDGNRGDEFAFMEPPAAVERPWTADVPSVIDYRFDADGRAVSVRDQENLARVQSSLLALYQEVTGRAVEVVADHIAAGGMTREDLEGPARESLRRYYEEPLPGIADLWFGSEHDDTFGVLNVTPFGKDAPQPRWLSQGWDAVNDHVASAAEASLWGAGYRRWLPVHAIVALRDLVTSSA